VRLAHAQAAHFRRIDTVSAKRLCLLLTLVPACVLVLPAPAGAQRRADPSKRVTRVTDSPIEIKVSTSVDERLFLLYALEEIYRTFPATNSGSTRLTDWLASTRAFVRRLQHHAGESKIDADVVTLYKDCLGVLESYEDLLATLGSISKADVARRARDSYSSGFDAGKLGRKVYDSSRASGLSSKQALGRAGAAAAIMYLLGEANRARERDAARKRAIDAATRKFRNSMEDAVARAGVVAGRLSTRYRWKSGEANFSASAKGTLASRYPTQARNPFAVVAYANSRLWWGRTGEARMAEARRCLAAASLVPRGTIYDGYRIAFISDAARLAYWAVTMDQAPRGYSGTPSKYAPEAVRFWRTLAARQGEKLAGNDAWQFWETLACAGRHNDAMKIANQLLAWNNRMRDSYRAYNFVRLQGAARNDSKLILKNLAVAFAFGFSDIKRVRNDPDLARVRTEQPVAWADLVKVKADYRLFFGKFTSDDVTMKNTSAFPLTNIVLDLKFVKGSQTWYRQVKLYYLAPGATHKFANVVSIPGSKVTAWYATLKSDQDPK
jgi:hypothetical protein